MLLMGQFTIALRFVVSALTVMRVSTRPPVTAPKSPFTRPMIGTFAAATSAATDCFRTR